MKLLVLWGQRKESYEGEYAPEPLLCWSEYQVEENPEGWERELDEQKKVVGADMQAMRVIELDVPDDRVRKLLVGVPVLKAGLPKEGDRLEHEKSLQTCTVKRVLVEVEVDQVPGRLFTYEAKNLKPVPGACCQCAKTLNRDGSPVLWQCQNCKRNVCRDCTRTILGKVPVEYHHMTLCSQACWEQAGRPSD